MSGDAGADEPAAREPLVGRGHTTGGRGCEDELPVDSTGPAGLNEARLAAARWIPRPALVEPKRSWPPTRLRLGLGIALVAALAIAWIVLTSGGPPAAVTGQSVPASAPVRTTHRAATAQTRAAAVPSWVPRSIASTCAARANVAPAIVVVECRPGRGVEHLRYTAFRSVVALRAAYQTAPHSRRGGNGDSKCARGARDERSWSIATRPATAVGRYRCANANGHARIVWTDERARVLATASRADADLRSLYAWWTTVPGPSPAPTGR